MKFPKALLSKERPYLKVTVFNPKTKIFIRIKPNSSQWNSQENIPYYEQIRSEQSSNWDLLSIPIWTRFNDQKEYKSEYAVIGFYIQCVQNLKDEKHSANWQIQHAKLPNNYSHCDLTLTQCPDRIGKRAMKMKLKHSAIICLYPSATRSKLSNLIDICHMKIKKLQYSFFINQQ